MAIYPSNLVQQGRAPSIMPGTMKPIVGFVALPAGVTLATNDTIPLFSLSSGGGAHIFSVLIGSQALDSGATVSISLVDSMTPTPNIIVPTSTTFRAGGVITDAQLAPLLFGAGVTYTTPNLIQLLVTAGAGAAIGAGGARINFNIGVSSD